MKMNVDGLKGGNKGCEKTVIFTVRFGRAMRKIEMKETQTLDRLQAAIIEDEFGWDDPHAYSFFLDGIPYSKNEEMEYSNAFKESGAKPSDAKLKDLGLQKGQKISFVFDFGDDHRFNIAVDGFGEVQKGKKYPAILEAKGKAPKQYPDMEDEEEGEE